MKAHLIVPAVLILMTSLIPAVAIFASSGLVEGDPQTLLVQPEDFPADLPEWEGDAQENGYMAVFSKPQSLVASGDNPGALLGVMAKLELLDGVPEASARFAEDQQAPSLGSPAATADGEQRTITTRQLSAEVSGVDEALLFRVEYQLRDVRMVDYRYRLRVANAVANLVVSARLADGDAEPAAIPEQARGIASRQATRLQAALQD